MDPSIWSRIPDNILTHVLARLQLTCLLKLRLVSQSWNSRILSPALATLRARILPHRPGFVRVSAFRSSDGHLQLDYLDRHFHWRKICLGVPPESVEIEGASGHLLCLSMTFSSLDGYVFKRFLMCNPVTAACKYLPPTLVTCYPIIVGLILDRASGDYVLLFGGNFKIAKGEKKATRTAEVYRSSTRKWNRVPDMPSGITPVLTSVVCNGRIYWLGWDDDESFGLLFFDPKTERWGWVCTVCDVECYMPWGLMERHGNLYKVGRVSSRNSAAYVWELQAELMAWRVVSEVLQDSEHHWRGCVRYCAGHDAAFCADNTCGTGGLIYKFHDGNQVSLFRTPACPSEEQLEHPETVAPTVSSKGDEENFFHESDGELSSSGWSGSDDSSEDEQLEPDFDTFAADCTPGMVAPFGHLYVFEPSLGKV